MFLCYKYKVPCTWYREYTKNEYAQALDCFIKHTFLFASKFAIGIYYDNKYIYEIHSIITTATRMWQSTVVHGESFSYTRNVLSYIVLPFIIFFGRLTRYSDNHLYNDNDCRWRTLHYSTYVQHPRLRSVYILISGVNRGGIDKRGMVQPLLSHTSID